MKYFYERSNITDKTNPVNKTYDDILNMSQEEIDTWINDLRNDVIGRWDNDGIPPVIGKNEEQIIKGWHKLKDYDTEKFWFDDSDSLGIIRNFSKQASGINQFFPTMLKTKISSGISADGGKSIYDSFKDNELRESFKKSMMRAIRRDSMYSYSKCIKKSDIGTANIKDLFLKYKDDTEYGVFLLRHKHNIPVYNNTNYKYVVVKSDEIRRLYKDGIITDKVISNLEVPVGDLCEKFNLKNGDVRYWVHLIRVYKRDTRIFPAALQVFRLSLGQPAVNFPPLTAKFLYEKYTKHIDGDLVIYDPSAGWGGRILGAMCSNRKIHYIGTDPNPDNYNPINRYEYVAKFYHEKCSNKFFGDNNTYEVHMNGSEDFDFGKYSGKLDFVFTSPPYFNREQYSQDENQSFKKFSQYEDWRDNFLRPTLTNCFTNLKNDRWLAWNIADIKVSGNKFVPLEQDSIDILEELGMEYEGKIKMLMTRMMGIKPKGVKNSVKVDGTYYKYEPILMFYKGYK